MKFAFDLIKDPSMTVVMDRNQRILLFLCIIYGIWNTGTQWTTTLLSFLQWDTIHVMTIVDIGYIQSFGSFCNAIGALAVGQLLRVGYQLDATAEMYLATITTERERTSALMRLTVPQALAMLLGPMFASQLAVKTSLRASQFICGIALIVTLTPFIYYVLPQTHSVPKLATARLRPQDYLSMIKHNIALREGILLRGLLIAAYICYELISRNFLLRSLMQGPNDSAKVLIVMGTSLLAVQFLLLPYLQRRFYPRTVLIIALIGLSCAYLSINFTTNFNQLLVVVALQTACYAVAYAESYTQITSAVDMTDLGKATGLASAAQWITHFIVPIYTSHIVQSWHYTYAFYTSAILSVGALCYVILVTKHSNARVSSLLPSISLA
uniref:Major facilitator superfamily (MFS) profile domain-containing protein n=1 Tax=Setaria digitata TaxID=48799 RepID=A0A915Q7C5_9BILA